MRQDRPAIADILPGARAYLSSRASGGLQGAFAPGGRMTDDRLISCAEEAAESRDQDGLRLARVLLRLSKSQRYRLRRLLKPVLA